MTSVITDGNAGGVTVEYLIDASGKKTVLVVETHLELDPIETDFDQAAVDALCRDLEQHRAENPYLDAIRQVELTGRIGDQEFKIPGHATYDGR
jgi:hypothetical protein